MQEEQRGEARVARRARAEVRRGDVAAAVHVERLERLQHEVVRRRVGAEHDVALPRARVGLLEEVVVLRHAEALPDQLARGLLVGVEADLRKVS